MPLVPRLPCWDWAGRLLLAASLALAACEDDPAPAAQADAVQTADAATDSTDAAPVRPDLAWDLRQPGPFKAGFRTWTHTYSPPGQAAPRTIALSVWYPTQATSGTPATYFGVFDDPLAFADAELAPPAADGQYPVHLYSHGHQGYGASSPHLARHFASHGWVFVAPDHTGNTFSDGPNARTPFIYWVRMADTSATLDALAALPATDPLAGKLQLERTLLSAHSFGCWNALAVAGAQLNAAEVAARCPGWAKPDAPCDAAALAQLAKDWRDPRVAAVVPMANSVGDAGAFGAAGLAKLAVPALVLTGTDDPTHEGAPVWPWFAGTASIWVDITDGCHQLFALGSCPKLVDTVGTPIVNTYVLAFARHHILGDQLAETLAILDGSQQVSALAALQRQ